VNIPEYTCKLATLAWLTPLFVEMSTSRKGPILSSFSVQLHHCFGERYRLAIRYVSGVSSVIHGEAVGYDPYKIGSVRLSLAHYFP